MGVTPQRILCATDFSPTGDWVKQMAVVLARRFDAERHLLHVQLLGWLAESVLRRCPVPLPTVRR